MTDARHRPPQNKQAQNRQAQNRGRHGLTALLAGSVLLTLLADPAQAQAASVGGVLDDVVAQIRKSFEGVGDRIREIAWAALISLLIVDFTLRAGRGMFSDEGGMSPLLKGFAFQIGFVALIYGFIQFVPEFVDFLANTAVTIAGAASNPGTYHPGGGLSTPPSVSASDLVADGLGRALGWVQAISVLSPGTWFFLIAAAVSVVVLAITVAILVVTWAELYLAALAGMITLMFAGLTETRDKALSYINGVIGKAFKLMGLLIIVAATGEMTDAMARMDGAGFGAAMGMILLQIVTLVLIMTLPGTLERMVGGAFATRSAEVIGKMAGSVAAMGVGAAVGAGLGGMAKGGSAAAGAVKGGATPGEITKAAIRGLGGGVASGGKAGAQLGQDVADRGVIKGVSRAARTPLADKRGDWQ